MKSILFALCVFSLNAVAEPNLIFADGGLQMQTTWTTGPRVRQESVLRLALKDGNTLQPIAAPGEIRVRPMMRMSGGEHGTSPVTIRAVEGQVGVFDVSRLYLTMGGEWDIEVTLVYSNGRQEMKSFKVKLEGGHRH